MRTPTCQCGECKKCKQREYHREWKRRNPDYYQRYYDHRDPARPRRREQRSNRDRWTPEQDALLGTMRDVDVAKLIDKTPHAVLKRRQRLGVKGFRKTERRQRAERMGKHKEYLATWIPSHDPMASMRMHHGYVMQHRLIMADYLGRPLVRDEVVHHRNGIKTDNRIENLELWTRSHPDGQRVVDMLAWAREFITRYEPYSLQLSFFGME